MEHQEAEALFDKYRRGETNAAENALVESWYLNEVAQTETVGMQMDYEMQEQRIWSRIQEQKAAREHSQAVKKIWMWPRIAAVSMSWKIAVALAAVTLGTWLYVNEIASSRKASRNDELVTNANDIAPGRNTATLTLADGKVINLSDAKTGVVIDPNSLKYNDGTAISSSLREGTTKQSHNEIASSRNASRNDVEVKTPRGGTYQVVLPDGTKAWLNAASSIRFPSSFAGTKQRRIEMTGEVYLEVAKDKKHPFIVESKGQEVTVLGTHFNVNAYSDEQAVKTTLLEGSVRVSSLATSPSLREGTRKTSSGQALKQSHIEKQNEIASSQSAPRNDEQGVDGTTILKPGQQSVLSGNNRIKVVPVDPAEAIAWKNNKFIFENDNIQHIMRMVERWYNVQVRYDGEITKETFGGAVSRYESISEVLKPLEATGKVKFKIEGRTIIVTK